MYCPNCFSKLENIDFCTNCNFEVKSLKEFQLFSGELFRKAINEFKTGDLKSSAASCILALTLYPFNPELLRFSILLFIDTGNYLYAKDAIEILKKIDPSTAEEFEKELIKVIDRYNILIRNAKSGSKVFLNEINTLTTAEREIVNVIIDKAAEDKINTEQKSKVKFSGSLTLNRITFVVGLIMIMLEVFLIFRGKETVYIQSSINNSSAPSDSLAKLNTINNILVKLTNSSFTGNKDSLRASFLTLQKADSNLFSKLDNRFISSLSYHFYSSGRKEYLARNYELAGSYFNFSYKLNPSTWFSDDALFYHAVCLQKLNDIRYKSVLKELVNIHNSSLYKKEAVRILNQSHETIE